MLETENLRVAFSADAPPVLKEVSVRFLPGRMNALVGPSGCGKTTLMRAFLGAVPAEGRCLYRDRPLEIPGDLAGRIGYVPQFCLAHSNLTVAEALAATSRLHCRRGHHKRVEEVLKFTGLDVIRDQRCAQLSGGQQRRLALALEMVPDPEIFLCDEVTTGLDPESENRILDLLGVLNRERNKTFVNIIHNLAQLPRFDWIVVLYKGEVAYQGDYPGLVRRFGLKDPVELYDALERGIPPGPEEADAVIGDRGELPPVPVVRSPSAVSQFGTLLNRRFRLFFRDRGYLSLTLAITLGFPVLVVIFALDGLPPAGGLWVGGSANPLVGIQDRFDDTVAAINTGTLVSGLILFQAILLCLIGSNNGAREIAGERDLFEKERLRGLKPSAYTASKLVFTGLVSLLQGAWMAIFVKAVCRFPGDLVMQVAFLGVLTVAMSWLSLAFSSLLRSPDRSSLLSVYLVGFQLPLSGIVLALPDVLVWTFRPLISTYWSWAGYLDAFRLDPLYDAVARAAGEAVPDAVPAFVVLGAHCLIAGTLIATGVARRNPVK